jgi:hypothetical protein
LAVINDEISQPRVQRLLWHRLAALLSISLTSIGAVPIQR